MKQESGGDENKKEEASGFLGSKISRRSFLKRTAATGIGTVAVVKLLGIDKKIFDSLSPERAAEVTSDELLPSTCWVGKQDCGVLCRVVDGRIVKIEGHPDHPLNRGTLCPKGVAQISAIYDPYRLKAPLKRTNPKGQQGEWTEITWDEALTTVANKMNEARDVGDGAFVWQKGRSKAKSFYDKAFVNATDALKLHHGAYCSDAGYRALEYTIGRHAVLHPDFKHCNYMINLGWGITTSGGNKFCWLTWPRHLVEARQRGLKVVTIDPSLRSAGPHTDEWHPIKPGTDLAFLLAVSNVLIDKDYIDEEFLLKYSNAPFLIKQDGTKSIESEWVDTDGKTQYKYYVWNENTSSPAVWNTETGEFEPSDTKPALTGQYTVNSETVKTVFELFKEHLSDYTPQWAGPITGISSSEITRIAVELGESAMIGSTIELNGVKYPYRPVGIMAYHVAQQELGFQMLRAATIVFMLLGAIEAVGSARSDLTRALHSNFSKLADISIGDPPYNLYLNKSKYYPINSNNSSIAAQVMLDPDKYGLDQMPEAMLVHMANPIVSFPKTSVIIEAYKKLKFMAVIDCWMSETADYFGDIILPCATIEKYEGPMHKNDQYDDSYSLRLPPIDPLFKSKGEIDIYIDLCEKAGILFGSGGYIEEINKNVKLKDPYKLDLDTKPEVRDIFDRWAKGKGYGEDTADFGIKYFEKNGVSDEGSLELDDLYRREDEVYTGIRYRIYGEELMKYGETMNSKGAEEIYWQDYTALPTWRTPTMDSSPSGYDLYLISTKMVEFKQSRATFISLLNEVAPEQRIRLNSATARAKGISDGDEVEVESHNAVTGETSKVRAKAYVVEHLRPDTVDMPNHYGLWVHPLMKNGGPTPNELFFTGKGYVGSTADQTFHVKVKVTKVGG
jgi:anaerobic selenocysteine-containing dehydrogenase